MTHRNHDRHRMALEEASALAARFYTDPATFKLEQEVGFSRTRQLGPVSGGYGPGRLSPKREAGVWHFQNLLRQAYQNS